MSRKLLGVAEGLLRAAERQSEELEKLLERVNRSMSQTGSDSRLPAAPAPEEPASGAAGASRAATGHAA
jgi:hypothetical protein